MLPDWLRWKIELKLDTRRPGKKCAGLTGAQARKPHTKQREIRTHGQIDPRRLRLYQM